MKQKTMKSHIYGFTVVELLIAVAVIVILAAVSTVGFRGANKQAGDVNLLNDATKAADQLELDFIKNGRYPATAAAANNNKGLTKSSGTSLTYVVASDGTAYCLQSSASSGSAKTYKVGSESKASEGTCPATVASTAGSGGSGGSGGGGATQPPPPGPTDIRACAVSSNSLNVGFTLPANTQVSDFYLYVEDAAGTFHDDNVVNTRTSQGTYSYELPIQGMPANNQAFVQVQYFNGSLSSSAVSRTVSFGATDCN
jgi:prepilin-type N-terminal cleavage/methylation domain-containing protein